MSAFHVSTYLQMGDDFDSRNRFLKQRADGSFEGCVIGGTSESWGITARLVDVTIEITLRFKMGGYTFTAQEFTGYPAVNPTGTTTFVSSE